IEQWENEVSSHIYKRTLNTGISESWWFSLKETKSEIGNLLLKVGYLGSGAFGWRSDNRPINEWAYFIHTNLLSHETSRSEIYLLFEDFELLKYLDLAWPHLPLSIRER